MREEYLIRIHGVMEQDDDRDSVELMTRGSFVCREGSFYITYKETEATGYDGCTTVVRVNRDQRRVSMLRYGKNTSQLVIEKGVRHICHYETAYGAMSLGVAADEIESHLTEDGGAAPYVHHPGLSYALPDLSIPVEDLDYIEILE